MTVPRALAVQSVLYANHAEDVVRAALALANSASHAREAHLIGSWTLLLGDCSEEPVLAEQPLESIRAAVEAQGGRVEYTFFGANLGSARGHNELAARDDSELMLILNPDAQVSPDALGVLATAVVESAGIAEARQVPLEHPKDFAKYTGDTSWASTACAMTRRDVFEKVGGFDADTFFLYCDDVDYSWRVKLAGYRVVYEPAATVFHDKRVTVTGNWLASTAEIYYSAEAAILLAHKYSRPDLVKKLIAQYRSEGSEPVLRAVAEYVTRQRDGRLPVPIDARHKAAQFVKGNYAVHRF